MQLCSTQKPLPEVKTAADKPNAFTAAVTHLRLIKMAISLHVFGTALKCRTTCTLRAIGAGLSQHDVLTQTRLGHVWVYTIKGFETRVFAIR